MNTSVETPKLMARIRRIEGQVQGLAKNIENNVDTFQTLQLIASVRGALNGLMQQVLEAHISKHMARTSMTSEQRREENDKLLAVLRAYMK